MICCLVHCIWKSWASKKLWPHLIYLTNCSPEVTAFFSLSSTSSSSSTGSSSLSLLSFSSNFLEVSFLAGLPRGRVPGVICGCWGWAWPKIIVENTYKNTNFLVQFGRPLRLMCRQVPWVTVNLPLLLLLVEPDSEPELEFSCSTEICRLLLFEVFLPDFLLGEAVWLREFRLVNKTCCWVC